MLDKPLLLLLSVQKQVTQLCGVDTYVFKRILVCRCVLSRFNLSDLFSNGDYASGRCICYRLCSKITCSTLSMYVVYIEVL
jgi:hypothetical protein